MDILKGKYIELAIALWLLPVLQTFGQFSFSAEGYVFEKEYDSRMILTGFQPQSQIWERQLLRVPASVIHEGEKYEVVGIDSKAFLGLTTVKSIVIEDGVEWIEDYAFEGCVNLKSIYIPASVEDIGKGLFSNCFQLTEIVVDSLNVCYDSREQSNAIIDSEKNILLAGCLATKIPASVTAIGERAFYNCAMLEHLIIPENVESIGRSAFSGCGSLKRLILPNSLKEIDADAFCFCSSLQSVRIPKNVCSIHEGNVFRGCYNLNGIEVDAANRFYDSRSGCNGIVRKSDSALIATCRMTKICEGIQVLGDNCFCGTIISSVTLPKSVVVISYEAFRHCYGIDALDVETGNMSYMSPQGSNAILTKDGKTLVLGCCNTIIPDGVREIGEYAFCGRYNSPILRFPDGLRTIRGSAFINCNMSGIHIPDSVTFIGPNAFEGCQYLTVVKMSSSSLESIQSGTFSGCGNLSIVQLPEGLKSIGKHAFKDCGSLKNVYIPSSVTSVAEDAFLNCPASNQE